MKHLNWLNNLRQQEHNMQRFKLLETNISWRAQPGDYRLSTSAVAPSRVADHGMAGLGLHGHRASASSNHTSTDNIQATETIGHNLNLVGSLLLSGFQTVVGTCVEA